MPSFGLVTEWGEGISGQQGDTQRDLGRFHWAVGCGYLPHQPVHIFPDFGDGNSVSWRNGSCVASEDCKRNYSVSALTYGTSLGFWVNTTCCQGNCQEPTQLGTSPPGSSTVAAEGWWADFEGSLSSAEKGRWAGRPVNPIPNRFPKSPHPSSAGALNQVTPLWPTPRAPKAWEVLKVPLAPRPVQQLCRP